MDAKQFFTGSCSEMLACRIQLRLGMVNPNHLVSYVYTSIYSFYTLQNNSYGIILW